MLLLNVRYKRMTNYVGTFLTRSIISETRKTTQTVLSLCLT